MWTSITPLESFFITQIQNNRHTLAYPGPNSAWSPAPPHSPPGAKCTQCRWATGWHAQRTPPAAPGAVCCPTGTPHMRTLQAAWTATDLSPAKTGALWWKSAGSDWRKSLQFALQRKSKNNWRPGGGHGTQMMPGFHTQLHGNYSVWTLVRTFWFDKVSGVISPPFFIDHLWRLNTLILLRLDAKHPASWRVRIQGFTMLLVQNWTPLVTWLQYHSY